MSIPIFVRWDEEGECHCNSQANNCKGLNLVLMLRMEKREDSGT